ELLQERGIDRRDLAIDAKTRVGPAPNPLAVVQVGVGRRAESRVGLVIAAAGAERPGPARRALGLRGNVVRLQERRLRGAIDAAAHVSQPMLVGPGEAVAERHVARGRDAKEPEARAARPRFGGAAMDFTDRLAHVAE